MASAVTCPVTSSDLKWHEVIAWSWTLEKNTSPSTSEDQSVNVPVPYHVEERHKKLHGVQLLEVRSSTERLFQCEQLLDQVLCVGVLVAVGIPQVASLHGHQHDGYLGVNNIQTLRGGTHDAIWIQQMQFYTDWRLFTQRKYFNTYCIKSDENNVSTVTLLTCNKIYITDNTVRTYLYSLNCTCMLPASHSTFISLSLLSHFPNLRGDENGLDN